MLLKLSMARPRATEELKANDASSKTVDVAASTSNMVRSDWEYESMVLMRFSAKDQIAAKCRRMIYFWPSRSSWRTKRTSFINDFFDCDKWSKVFPECGACTLHATAGLDFGQRLYHKTYFCPATASQ